MWDDCEGIGRLRDGREVLRTKEGTRHAQERKMIVRRVKAGLWVRDLPPWIVPSSVVRNWVIRKGSSWPESGIPQSRLSVTCARRRF